MEPSNAGAISQEIAETGVRSLYQSLLAAWNERNASAFAAHFETSGNTVGFDGSQLDEQPAIETELTRIFASHKTAAYVGIVREVRMLAEDIALLRAVGGMVPPSQRTINPATNAIQCMVAVRKRGEWRIALYQNTPAALHERPTLRNDLTVELQTAFDSRIGG